MLRIARDHDLPLHYEASPLGAPFLAIGWPAGVVAIRLAADTSLNAAVDR